MPSGVLYTRGLLASYVEALFLTLFGFSYTVGRLPSVVFGLGTIITTAWIGNRAWQTPSGWGAGWLAAAGLALLPEAVIWSGRARFYAQLQFFALLAVWASWRMIAYADPPKTVQGQADGASHSKIRNPKSKIFWLFPTLFILALFSQEETILLYPATLLATVLWRGWREFRRREVLFVHLACLAALAVRFAIEIFGQPGYFETIQAERPYVGLIFDVRGAWRTYAPLLIAPERLGWTLSGLLAIGAALAALRTTRWRLAELPQFHQATLFFALHFLIVVAFIFGFVGTSWREARYLFLVQPFWLLAGAAGAVWLLSLLAQRTAARHAPTFVAIGVAALTILASASLFPAAQRVFTQQVEGYDRVLAHLAAARQPGDVVLSPQPPACALVLNACDFYAVQRGYEEFVIVRDGEHIDRWTGSTLLNSTAQLETAVRAASQTWFVVDSFRLATRYEPDFVRTVVEQFDIAYRERGVMLLRAAGWRDQPSMPMIQALDPPISFSPLALAGWERNEAQPGHDLHVILLWRGEQTIGQQYNTSVKIVAADGRVVQQADGPPARGLIPTNLFFDAPLPDLKTLALPADLPVGRYRIEVTAYDVATVTPLREPYALDWFTVGLSPAEPEQVID
jgi:4-amino-4-deoxy-L-arabinose transferase-like glycosyltransferase